jgi:hypothetical protein
MGLCQSKENLQVVSPIPLDDINAHEEEPVIQITPPPEPSHLAQRLNGTKSVDEACTCLISELSRVTGSSAILILTDLALQKTFYSAAAKEESDLEDNSELFSSASQYCLDSDRSESRVLLTSNLLGDSRFIPGIPTQSPILSTLSTVLQISSLIVAPVEATKTSDYGSLILFGPGVSREDEGVLTLFSALATLKIDSLKAAMMQKDLFEYYHCALPSQILSYNLWESTFLESLPTTEEIQSTKFDPHLYDVSDDTLVYVFKAMFKDMFENTVFSMNDEQLIIYALTVRK